AEGCGREWALVGQRDPNVLGGGRQCGGAVGRSTSPAGRNFKRKIRGWNSCPPSGSTSKAEPTANATLAPYTATPDRSPPATCSCSGWASTSASTTVSTHPLGDVPAKNGPPASRPPTVQPFPSASKPSA